MKILKTKRTLSDKCQEFFKDYPGNSSISAQITWLRTRVLDDINPELYECILKIHRIEATDSPNYNEIVAAYWEGNMPKFTEIKLQAIRDDYFNKVKNYEFYISFPIDDDKNIYHKLVGHFTLDPPCYSIPFFEALTQEYKSDATLVFTLGKIDDNVTVVFYINNAENSFYDYSQIPPFAKDGKPNHVGI